MNYGPLPYGGSYEQDWNRYYSPGFYGGAPLASVADRYGAAAIDYGVPVLFVIWSQILGWNYSILFLLFLVWLNSAAALQGTTGRSIGKLLTGIKLGLVINDSSGQLMFIRPGVGVCTKRLFVHIQDLYTFTYALATHVDRQSFADQSQRTMGLAGSVRLFPPPPHYGTVMPR